MVECDDYDKLLRIKSSYNCREFPFPEDQRQWLASEICQDTAVKVLAKPNGYYRSLKLYRIRSDKQISDEDGAEHPSSFLRRFNKLMLIWLAG